MMAKDDRDGRDGRSDLKWFADMEKQQGNHELKLLQYRTENLV